MSTTSAGREAEDAVACLLKKQKHKIVSMNWRTRWCEIDIVSTHKRIVYFTEVKFRRTSDWGDGLEYITAAKLKQMRFAAELWLSTQNWEGDALLQAASVSYDGSIELIELF